MPAVSNSRTAGKLLMLLLSVSCIAWASAQTGLRRVQHDSAPASSSNSTVHRPASVLVGGNSVITTPTSPTPTPVPQAAVIIKEEPNPAPMLTSVAASTPAAVVVASSMAIAPTAAPVAAAQMNIPLPATQAPTPVLTAAAAVPAFLATDAIPAANASGPVYTQGIATYFGDPKVGGALFRGGLFRRGPISKQT